MMSSLIDPVTIAFPSLRYARHASTPGLSPTRLGYLRGLRVHINLIPNNSIREGHGLIGTTAERRRFFSTALTAAGFTVTVRYSLGADIAAACGQLARLETAALVGDSSIVGQTS
jgi:hypothetical protein